MNELLIVDLARAKEFGFGVGGDDLARDQAVRTEALDDLEMTAFEVQVCFLDHRAVDLPGRERREVFEHRLVAVLTR